jgi:hypothetical protein
VPHVKHRHPRGSGSSEYLRGSPHHGVAFAYVLVDADLRVIDQDGGPTRCAHLRDRLRHIDAMGVLHAASMSEPRGLRPHLRCSGPALSAVDWSAPTAGALGISSMTLVDLMTATASEPGTNSSSRTASVLINDTTRYGPH